MNIPFFSIIIPTRNSQKFLGISLDSIMKQTNAEFEVIVADNSSTDSTVATAQRMGARTVVIPGNPPQVSRQRNAGAKAARGRYLLILDHDMELPTGFLESLKKEVAANPSVDAWYIPEHIQASNGFLSEMRTFENEIYRDTAICAARVINAEVFRRLKGYDLLLSGGPADWDFDMTLRETNAVIRTTKGYLIHHEESLRFWDYVRKKNKYHHGVDLYVEKWKTRNAYLYRTVVKKQFSLYFRLFGIFFVPTKLRYTLTHVHLYIGFLVTRFIMFWYY